MPTLLDFIFPKKCVSCNSIGSYFCERCNRKIVKVEKPICPVCQRQAIGGKTHPVCKTKYSLDGLVFGCRYRGSVKKAIGKVKYRWVYDIGGDLVDLVTTQIYKFDIPKDLILVPVPLHTKRKKWRGFNQSEIIARDLSKKFKVKYADLLIRVRETKTQVGLDKNKRKKNVRGAFELRRNSNVKNSPRLAGEAGQNLMLVDDVYTSGATMAECAKILKRAGAKSVWGLVIALG